ncbi:hypothetical protein F4774DRAFT_399400 [Daldinia eschscholtzii]|nr:hypothetical protein F4774DRAFT_399400 [Daldinia eschscholtzii]
MCIFVTRITISYSPKAVGSMNLGASFSRITMCIFIFFPFFFAIMSHALNQHRASTWILSFVRTRSRRIGRRFPGGYHASGTSHVRRGVWDARGLKRKLGEMNDDGDDDIRQGKDKDKAKVSVSVKFRLFVNHNLLPSPFSPRATRHNPP